jgi:hypothetical protein
MGIDQDPPFVIRAKCDNGHVQEITIRNQPRWYAEGLAFLMDGTSPMYVHSPIGTNSVIGKCGICRAQIHCELLPEIPEVQPVDRSARELSGGGPVTEDHREIIQEGARKGQQRGYVVLTAEERAKGFVEPVRRTYIHVGIDPEMKGHVLIKPGTQMSIIFRRACGQRTTCSLDIAETYARDPEFYSGTFCYGCGTHRPLEEFIWEGTTLQVGKRSTSQ